MVVAEGVAVRRGRGARLTLFARPARALKNDRRLLAAVRGRRGSLRRPRSLPATPYRPGDGRAGG